MIGFDRIRTWLGLGVRSARGTEPDPDDPDLAVVVSAFDEAEAASAALARSPAWREQLPAVLRHHLLLPDGAVSGAAELLEQDSWRLRTAGDAAPAEFGATPADGEVALFAERVQKLDALHCSQESSRMAGLAQRCGGRAVGWVALQRPPA